MLNVYISSSGRSLQKCDCVEQSNGSAILIVTEEPDNDGLSLGTVLRCGADIWEQFKTKEIEILDIEYLDRLQPTQAYLDWLD